MATIFTKIINGEIPGRFVWSDDVCIGMLDIRPLHHGHVLVIPRVEVDHWIDLPADTASHLMTVAHTVGNAQRAVVGSSRIGLMIAGFEVPHTHVHVVPIDGMGDLDFRNAETSPRADLLDEVAEQLRAALREAGHDDSVPDN
ncbi:MAG: HIT family protein [Acidimicrobiales bacterium]